MLHAIGVAARRIETARKESPETRLCMRFCAEVWHMICAMLPRRISEATSRTEPQTKFGACRSCEGPSRLMAQLVIIEKAANNIEMFIMTKPTNHRAKNLLEVKSSRFAHVSARHRLGSCLRYGGLMFNRCAERCGASNERDALRGRM